MMFERLRKILIRRVISVPGSTQQREDLRPTDDWEVGDLAECINGDGKWYCMQTSKSCPGPTYKDVLKVVGVKYVGLVATLKFSQYPGSRYNSADFRKIIPRADKATRSERSFAELVRRRSPPADKQPQRLKPKRSREDA